MEFKVTELEPSKQEVEFEIQFEELTPYFEKAYIKYQKKAEIAGFRKGKVPISVLKRMYGEAIEHSSLEDVANEFFKKYLDENKVQMIGEGSLTDMNFEPGKLFKFKIEYEIKPVFDLASYKELQITQTVYSIGDKQVDDEIKYLREKNCSYESAEKATGDDYVVTLNVQKLDESGLPVIGHSEKDVKFYLNDVNLDTELKSQLQGISPGEERKLTVKNNPDNKTLSYTVKASKVERIILPDLGPEFFKKVYKKDVVSLEEFRALVKTDLENIYKNISSQELRNNIISELIKLNDIPVPEKLIDGVLNSYIEDIKGQSPKRELPAGFNVEEYKKTRRADAILEVKWYLIRDKIIELEHIEATDSDMKQLIEADAQKYNLPVDKVESIYMKNHEIKHKIQDKKVMDFLVKNSKIKETKQSIEQKINN